MEEKNKTGGEEDRKVESGCWFTFGYLWLLSSVSHQGKVSAVISDLAKLKRGIIHIIYIQFIYGVD